MLTFYFFTKKSATIQTWVISQWSFQRKQELGESWLAQYQEAARVFLELSQNSSFGLASPADPSVFDFDISEAQVIALVDSDGREVVYMSFNPQVIIEHDLDEIKTLKAAKESKLIRWYFSLSAFDSYIERQEIAMRREHQRRELLAEAAKYEEMAQNLKAQAQML